MPSGTPTLLRKISDTNTRRNVDGGDPQRSVRLSGLSSRDAQAFNRAFERGMQQQMRVAGMIGVVGTVGVGGYYAPGAYRLAAPHVARGYAWARSPQTHAAVHRLGVSGVHRLQGLAGQVAYPSVRTLGLSGVMGGVSGGVRGYTGDQVGFSGLSGVELGIYAPVSLPFLIMDSLVSEGISRW